MLAESVQRTFENVSDDAALTRRLHSLEKSDETFKAWMAQFPEFTEH